ncbi:hypothetical protein ACOTTU_19925 [Roseobacter sp. EG26]|uniref:hypothetical protein n=1 Tax=Roseobacter sp. EG26 TaxID=3412477 RepID=UPI003CE5859A
MAEADLLNIIEVVAQDAEALGFPKTAMALWRIVQENNGLQNGRICPLGNTSATHKSSTLLN